VNLGCGIGHPSYVMSSSLRPRPLRRSSSGPSRKNAPASIRSALCAAQDLDEKVARLQLKKLNCRAHELTDAQARYIGVSKAGPYKADHYRY